MVLIQKINNFLSNIRNFFLFYDLCLKYAIVNYISASCTA